jgi:hypothetical protein
MNEYFVIANSFAAPFFSDTSSEYVKSENPQEAILKFVKKYKHPCGLYAAVLYKDKAFPHLNEFKITVEEVKRRKG